MAKQSTNVSLKGVLEITDETIEITEASKESIQTFDLQEILRQFSGHEISISIKQEDAIQPIEE